MNGPPRRNDSESLIGAKTNGLFIFSLGWSHPLPSDCTRRHGSSGSKNGRLTTGLRFGQGLWDKRIVNAFQWRPSQKRVIGVRSDKYIATCAWNKKKDDCFFCGKQVMKKCFVSLKKGDTQITFFLFLNCANQTPQ